MSRAGAARAAEPPRPGPGRTGTRPTDGGCSAEAPGAGSCQYRELAGDWESARAARRTQAAAAAAAGGSWQASRAQRGHAERPEAARPPPAKRRDPRAAPSAPSPSGLPPSPARNMAQPPPRRLPGRAQCVPQQACRPQARSAPPGRGAAARAGREVRSPGGTGWTDGLAGRGCGDVGELGRSGPGGRAGRRRRTAGVCRPQLCTPRAKLETGAPGGPHVRSASARCVWGSPAPCPLKSRLAEQPEPPGGGPYRPVPSPWISPGLSVGQVLGKQPLSGEGEKVPCCDTLEISGRSRIGGDPQVEQEGLGGREGRGASCRGNLGDLTTLWKRRAGAHLTCEALQFSGGTAIYVRGKRLVT